MPSPFPGMNPYLEQEDTWDDFHTNFITRVQQALVAVVGSNYLVKLEVQLYLHELSAEERRHLPAVDVERHCSLAIRNLQNRELVTIFNLLKPAHKAAGLIRSDFLQRRQHLLEGRSNVVEIDLRRGGERPPKVPACDYYALVAREDGRNCYAVWTIALRDRLPVIPIPLSAPDNDVVLDLQDVLNTVYDSAD